MARGWESKSIESQIEDSTSTTEPRAKPRTPEELRLHRQRDDLLLSRQRILQQLEASTNERYSSMLRQALSELDARIAKLST